MLDMPPPSSVPKWADTVDEQAWKQQLMRGIDAKPNANNAEVVDEKDRAAVEEPKQTIKNQVNAPSKSKPKTKNPSKQSKSSKNKAKGKQKSKGGSGNKQR